MAVFNLIQNVPNVLVCNTVLSSMSQTCLIPNRTYLIKYYIFLCRYLIHMYMPVSYTHLNMRWYTLVTTVLSVSYTHLDVYKRQPYFHSLRNMEVI